jgi:DNA-binding FadR family transcriptional regulator
VVTRRPGAAIAPVKKHKLSDEVIARLETAIRDGTYPPGAALPAERELMALFEVGRPSVREALYALQKRGLIRIAAGQRAKVIPPSPRHLIDEMGSSARLLLDQPEGVDHFEQARLALEIFLTLYACDHAGADDLARLAAALDANEAAIGRPEAFIASDVAFHRVLAELPGNPIFLALHDAVVEWIIHERPLLRNTAANNRRSHHQHGAILEAIRRRDALAAITAMRVHLGDAKQRYSTAAAPARSGGADR